MGYARRRGRAGGLADVEDGERDTKLPARIWRKRRWYIEQREQEKRNRVTAYSLHEGVCTIPRSQKQFRKKRQQTIHAQGKSFHPRTI